MKFVLWNKVKNSYNKYKFNKKYSQLFITVLCVIVLIVEIVLVVIGKILTEFFHALQEWDERRRIENRIRRQRHMELKAIYEENRAAGCGFQDGITNSKYETTLAIRERKRREAEHKAYIENAGMNVYGIGRKPSNYMQPKRFKPPWEL